MIAVNEKVFIEFVKNNLFKKYETLLRELKREILSVNRTNNFSEETKQKAIDEIRIMSGKFMDEIQNLTQAILKVGEGDKKAEAERGQGNLELNTKADIPKGMQIVMNLNKFTKGGT